MVACAAFGTIFLLVKLFPLMQNVLGQHGTYFLFAMVCVGLAFFTQVFIPETRYVNLLPYLFQRFFGHESLQVQGPQTQTRQK